MKYNAQIEQVIIDQIRATPDRPVILPDWAYRKDRGQPTVHVGGDRVPLMRRLHELLVGDIDPAHSLLNPTGIPARNVNPLLAREMLSRITTTACQRCGTEFDDARDYVPGVGYRCHTCAARRAERDEANRVIFRRPNVGEINRAKTVCPQGHPLTGSNLIKLKSGKRKCKICHRADVARWRKKRRTTT